MTRPNILLITTDQQHFSTLGAVNPKIRTPNLDRLCEMGTRFDRAYCPSPVCTPSRASILTGLYPSQHGAWTIGTHLDEACRTLPGMLGKAGYMSGLVGKAHFHPLADTPGHTSLEKLPIVRDMEHWRGFNGPWYGFDHIELTRNHADEAMAGQHYGVWMEDRELADWRDYFQPAPGETSARAIAIGTNGEYWKRQARIWALPEDFHYTRWTGERSVVFIDDALAQDRPFFLWSSFHDPHPPYVLSEPWASMYDPAEMEPGALTPGEHDKNPPHFGKTQEENPDFGDWHEPFEAHGCHSHLHDRDELKKDMAIYYGMVSFLDQEVGRMLDLLEARGVLDDTLIVFTTDHGHFLGQHGLMAKGPFHYEDLLRVPFIAAWPGRIAAGAVSRSLQSLVDLAPTFLEAAGLAVPHDMQGVSLLEEWTGQRTTTRDFVLCENRHNPVMPHAVTHVDARYKITVYRAGAAGELFDLEADPNEVDNLWANPDFAALKSELLLRFAQSVLASERMKMPRVSHA